MGIQSYFHPEKPSQSGGQHRQLNHELAPFSTSSSNTAVIVPHPPTSTASRMDLSRASSPGVSRPGSMLDCGSNSSSSSTEILDIKCDVMVNYLYQQQRERLWITECAKDEGVVLKKSRGRYTCCPPELVENASGFMKAIENLNVRVCGPSLLKITHILIRLPRLPSLSARKSSNCSSSTAARILSHYQQVYEYKYCQTCPIYLVAKSISSQLSSLMPACSWFGTMTHANSYTELQRLKKSSSIWFGKTALLTIPA